MSTNTTIKVGESAKTITLPEGKTLTLTGSFGAAGVAYLLDPALGGVNSLKSWAVGTGSLAPIGPFSNSQKVMLTCSGGAIDATLQDGVLGTAQLDGGTLKTPAGMDAAVIAAVSPRGALLFVGDSRTQFGQPYRRPGTVESGAFDGRTVYVTSGSFNASTQWIAYGIIDGSAAINSQGIVRSDATGLLTYEHAGDTPGPKVDVSEGGWYYLKSGTNGVGITIAVRGAATKILNAGGTYMTSGFPLTWDYDLRGHVPWVAAAMGDTFSDYRAYAIPGASTADILKFLPQTFQRSAEAVVLSCGVNDIPDTGSTSAQVATAIANLKAIIDYCRARVARVYVCDVWQAPNKDAAAQRNIDKINTALRNYCRTVARVRYVGGNHQLVNYTATAAVGKPGVYFTDNLHYVPFGGYKCSLSIVAKMRQDYPTDGQRKGALDAWDSTLQSGACNPNPTMAGTTGTGVGSGGVTGIVPTSWAATRAGSTQTFNGAAEAATDGEGDWYTITVGGATTGDYHNLSSSINPFPPGIAIGDYYRVVAELKIGAMTTPGIGTLYVACTGNGNLNNIVLIQLTAGWGIDTFTTENPILPLFSEPQRLLATDPMTLRIRIGALAGGGGSISIRNFRIEKVPGPIYQ